MRFSERWLREWVNPPVDTSTLVHQLTNAGLEVDSVEAVSRGFSGVVVGKVVDCRPHPNADRLVVCRVEAGPGDEAVEVVCGAPNARAGLRGALARPGARIDEGVKVRRAKIRGVTSEGMLCSLRELGLGEDHSGIIELASDAPVGEDVYGLLELEDAALEIGVTPDRGDCLSIAGIAREVGAVNRLPVGGPALERVAARNEERLPIALDVPEGCARYVGRVIRGVSRDARTPLWMSERLRRSGVRGISPVVDVTNYVMLELGQPLHAFDRARITGGIRVRRAQPGERLTLLDERTVELRPSTLVIADHERPLALAGIMGGLGSAVGPETRDVFLESAWFNPADLMGEPRAYGLHTDASHRFERGVDPTRQRVAIERATSLLMEIAGGSPGPVVDEMVPEVLPRRAAVRLRASRIHRLLGMVFPRDLVGELLDRLGMKVETTEAGWSVTPPAHRFDIALEVDLIEEIARLAGYDRIPSVGIGGVANFGASREATVSVARLRRIMIDRGYREAVSYSFVDPSLQSLLDPETAPIRLANPISSELSVMRTNVWMGLCAAVVRNVNRQERRIRLFETGLGFRRDQSLVERIGDIEGWGDRGRDQVSDVEQERVLAAAAMGPVLPEQWGDGARDVDFFDLKSDLEALLEVTGEARRFEFEPLVHPALDPGQSAVIRERGAAVGILGCLHPRIRRELRLPKPVWVFEIALDSIMSGRLRRYAPVSRFPSVRRDIAVAVDANLSVADLLVGVRRSGSNILKKSIIFDVYEGDGIDAGKKSVAIGLTFQSDSRTLDDREVDEVIQRTMASLKEEFGAETRR